MHASIVSFILSVIWQQCANHRAIFVSEILNNSYIMLQLISAAWTMLIVPEDVCGCERLSYSKLCSVCSIDGSGDGLIIMLLIGHWSSLCLFFCTLAFRICYFAISIFHRK